MSKPRLYLITPSLGDADSFARGLPAALGAGDIAAVLLRLQPDGERTRIDRAKAVASAVHARDIALLLDGHAEIATRAAADGAHLTGIRALRAAVGALKPNRIAGAGGLRSRHDAMLAGETGADYVMFGEPSPSSHLEAEIRAHGSRPGFDAILDRVAWWAELFEVPCVGYAASLDEIEPLGKAGADFIALGEWIWTQESTPAEVITAAAQSLTAA